MDLGGKGEGLYEGLGSDNGPGPRHRKRQYSGYPSPISPGRAVTKRSPPEDIYRWLKKVACSSRSRGKRPITLAKTAKAEMEVV